MTTRARQPFSLVQWCNDHADLTSLLAITTGWIVMIALIFEIGRAHV